jgi:hypothetical protein
MSSLVKLGDEQYIDSLLLGETRLDCTLVTDTHALFTCVSDGRRIAICRKSFVNKDGIKSSHAFEVEHCGSKIHFYTPFVRKEIW